LEASEFIEYCKYCTVSSSVRAASYYKTNRRVSTDLRRKIFTFLSRWIAKVFRDLRDSDGSRDWPRRISTGDYNRYASQYIFSMSNSIRHCKIQLVIGLKSFFNILLTCTKYMRHFYKSKRMFKIFKCTILWQKWNFENWTESCSGGKIININIVNQTNINGLPFLVFDKYS